MKTQFTSPIEIITGKVKNNPTIYCSGNQFAIFLNGELIVSATATEDQPERVVFAEAKKVLQALKWNEFPVQDIQERFNSFIKE